jgi:predicted nucleic acid-binding protein
VEETSASAFGERRGANFRNPGGPVRAFFDSSSFAKRFVEEDGSDKAEALCAQASALGLGVICVPEIVSALARRKREHTLTTGQYAEAKQRLLQDVRDADIVNLTPTVIGSAIRVLEASPVRAIDALHVACALEWGAEVFASSDQRQLQAAKRAGLKTRNI